jgi:5-(carboxyamino)imidazole ribonucleotide synthase
MTRLGIFGGGQLAQMLTQAAISLGIETAIFERTADSPAARLTQHQVVGQWDDESALSAFASLCDRVTLENEFVDAGVLRRLESLGLLVYPTAATLAQVQDKLIQKQSMDAAGIPVPPFREVGSPEDVLTAAQDFDYPLVLKARRDGYDGYGNASLYSAEDVDAAWAKLGTGGRALYVEALVPFARELAVMVVRGADGEMRSYPVVETVQQNHICHVVRAPASSSPIVAENALAIARKAVETINGVGIFGVELFLLGDGQVLYNEIAPRPHNSGHYTIEGCVTSQFENHIRAVLGWPLGKTDLLAPAAVMVNILGRRNGAANSDAIRAALETPGAHMHIYGKRDSRIGRKMGHVTVLGDTVEMAEQAARQAADAVEL